MSFEQKISINEKDAKFITNIQKYVDPLFVGEYSPNYIDSDDMESIVWENTSPLGNEESQFIFTLEKDRISAIFMDLKESSNEFYQSISSNLSFLDGLKELVVILPDDKEMFDVSELSLLQYIQIHKDGDHPVGFHPDFSNLKDLCVLVIHGRVENIGPGMVELENMQRLVMRFTSLSGIPLEIYTLSNLVWLEFGDNFKSMSEDIEKLESLIVLDLVSDELTQLPENIGKLSNLAHLSLELRAVESFPASFSELKKLSDLYLWNIQLVTIPEQILKLTNLKYLWIKENSRLRGTLKEIPDEIDNLRNLEELQLNGHEIEEIPDSITNLSKLKVLNLSINYFNRLPKGIHKLSNLEKLEIYLTDISSLPERITELNKLSYLDISSTNITLLPKRFGDLKQMTDFDALGTPLEEFPESLTEINYRQFRTFMASLTVTLEELSDNLQTWIQNLVEYANEYPELEIEVEISLYEDEKEQEEEDSEEILIDDQD